MTAAVARPASAPAGIQCRPIRGEAGNTSAVRPVRLHPLGRRNACLHQQEQEQHEYKLNLLHQCRLQSKYSQPPGQPINPEE